MSPARQPFAAAQVIILFTCITIVAASDKEASFMSQTIAMLQRHIGCVLGTRRQVTQCGNNSSGRAQ